MLNKILLAVALALTPSVTTAQVALCVQAKVYWRHSVPVPAGTSADSTKYFAMLKWQTQRGDIIEIKPSSHVWGNLEKPPDVVIVEIVDMSMSQAVKFRQPLIDSALLDESKLRQPDSVNIKERRWHFSDAFVDSALAQFALDGSNLSMTTVQAGVFILEHDKATVKQEIRERTK